MTSLEALISNIKRLMSENKETQTSLAQKTSIKQPQLNTYLTGKVVPKLDAIESIAKALGVEVWSLLRPKAFEPDVIINSITDLCSGLDDAIKQVKAQEIEIRAKKPQYDPKEYMEELQSCEEVKGRLGMFRALIVDGFNSIIMPKGEKPKPLLAGYLKNFQGPTDFRGIYPGDQGEYMNHLNFQIADLESTLDHFRKENEELRTQVKLLEQFIADETGETKSTKKSR